jgi:hypothetical protein
VVPWCGHDRTPCRESAGGDAMLRRCRRDARVSPGVQRAEPSWIAVPHATTTRGLRVAAPLSTVMFRRFQGGAPDDPLMRGLQIRSHLTPLDGSMTYAERASLGVHRGCIERRNRTWERNCVNPGGEPAAWPSGFPGRTRDEWCPSMRRRESSRSGSSELAAAPKRRRTTRRQATPSRCLGSITGAAQLRSRSL